VREGGGGVLGGGGEGGVGGGPETTGWLLAQRRLLEGGGARGGGGCPMPHRLPAGGVQGVGVVDQPLRAARGVRVQGGRVWWYSRGGGCGPR